MPSSAVLPVPSSVAPASVVVVIVVAGATATAFAIAAIAVNWRKKAVIDDPAADLNVGSGFFLATAALELQTALCFEVECVAS